MWEQFLTTEPFYRPFVDLLELPAEEVGLTTDAAGSPEMGFGCSFQLEYLSQQWPRGLISPLGSNNPSICWLKLYTVATAVALWGDNFKNMRIVIDCDNQAAVNILNKGTSKCPKCMELMRFITCHAMSHNTI